MTEQDIIDTLPVVNAEFDEWIRFASSTEIYATAITCHKKAEVVALKKAGMLKRLAEFKTENIKGCPFDENLEK
jgi:hypothetical protein